ncbi:MAG TPA: MarR family winged helix-turn-helix transcriptional regulator [Chloroflexota bacterium]|nr:MarR family winged helix-turn-helix transcriptional regulator [Chloroflexota bacterium]
MVRLRRSQTRRTLSRLAGGEGVETAAAALFGMVDAVEEGPEWPGQEITVGVVAERLGSDPSRASRLVAAAIRAGYVSRVASQADGRRIRLELTEAGRALAARTHRFRQQIFARAMHDWPESERAAFARLLTRFSDSLARMTARR